MLALLLTACEPPVLATAAPRPTGEGLFLGGCPAAGLADARILGDPAERPWGEEALARPGDALLVNERAAFVIQGVDDPATYVHWGGQPIDAVAVAGCEQAGPELFEEMGFVVGRLDLGDFNASTLHQVHPTEIEVVNDGSDGKAAIVEARGTDDRFWLVEMTLARGAYTDGAPKSIGDLYGLDITIRYTLDPGAAALQIAVLLDGEPAEDGFMTGAIVFPSDDLQTFAFATGEISAGGFGLDVGVPWLAMGGHEGAQAVAMPGASMAYASISGVRALVDVKQAMSPPTVAGPGDPVVTPFLLGVGATDAASAGAALEPYLPEPVDGATWADLEGTVSVDGCCDRTDDPDVSIYAEESPGSWRLLDRVRAVDGAFHARTLDLGGPWRLVASMPGFDDSAPVDIVPGESASLSLSGNGEITIDARDETGAAIPVRAELEREDGRVEVIYALPGATHPLPPGTWHGWFSRGYEHAIAEADVVSAIDAVVSVELPRIVDTAGWASLDTHVHAEASADSDTLDADRFATAAAAGLDIVVSSDHEAIVDMQPALAASGLDAWVAYGLGTEITATVPEHVNAWGFPVRADHPRGDPVRWYAMGFPGLYAAAHERGARVIQLNHSRVNGECGILCVADWDRGADDPWLDDPVSLGMAEGTELWSWNLDSMEVMNGLRSPLLDPADTRRSGSLVDWLAMQNLGHRVTGMAVTDVHGLQIPGEPRTYVRVPDDTPGVVTADDAADAVLAGAAVISAGAFAEATVDGHGPGEIASVPGGAVTLSLRVEALPEVDVTTIYVLANCDLAAVETTTRPSEVLKFAGEIEFSLEQDAHIVVLGFGEGAMPRGLDTYDPRTVPRFITNPIFVDVDGDGKFAAPGAKGCTSGVEVGR